MYNILRKQGVGWVRPGPKTPDHTIYHDCCRLLRKIDSVRYCLYAVHAPSRHPNSNTFSHQHANVWILNFKENSPPPPLIVLLYMCVVNCIMWVLFHFMLYINPFVLHLIIVFISYFNYCSYSSGAKGKFPFKCIFNWTIKFLNWILNWIELKRPHSLLSSSVQVVHNRVIQPSSQRMLDFSQLYDCNFESSKQLSTPTMFL
jgi:hypothetical protein